MTVLLETELNLPLFSRGKVRDTYYFDHSLLIVATDRISAFDSVLPCGIPDKGKVLNRLSAFWFRKTGHIVPNHLVETIESTGQLEDHLASAAPYPQYLPGRSMIVRKAERLPVECVVRGYLSGSAWAEYTQSGTVCSMTLLPGLKESQKLPELLFTPTTKAESGHDLPLNMEQMKMLVGPALAQKLKEKSLAIYRYAQGYAGKRGIIIADTKMEFGLIDGDLTLIDELLTPDSSRFWDASCYVVGRPQPSLDKQPVRDWLIKSGWNKEPPAPMLPQEIIEQTAERYRQAYHRLTGEAL